MELPEKLLQKYPSVARKAKQTEKPEPMFRTFKVMLFFSDNTSEDMEITMPNKPYWGGAIRKGDCHHLEPSFSQ